MKKSTRLLLKSAEHWLENFDLAGKGQPIPLGVRYCALCLEYNDAPGKGPCEGCPVKDHTKRSGCWGTPYQEVLDAFREYGEGIRDDELQLACGKEYTFLVTLALKNR